jgi:2-dehydro-3-deoxygluconokinase
MRVVCIGECMVELRSLGTEHFARSYAGDAYNTAVYLKRSLPDADVQFLTATGDDAMSRAMRETWRVQGINDALAFTIGGGSPGLYLIETDASGERRFQYWRSHSAARHWLAMLLKHGEEAVWGADIVYLSGISLAILKPGERARGIELMQGLRSRVERVAFDPNVRLALWDTPQTAAKVTSSALSLCDIALPSTDDLRELFGINEPARQLGHVQEMGVHEVALTLGAGGCIVADGARRLQLPGPKIANVIDTSGAGDAFNGAYLAHRLLGGSPADAAQAGLDLAARVVTHAGAIVPASVSHPSDESRNLT